jgi:dephospho-CoA kinase
LAGGTPVRLGITGNIGTGKSMVARMLKQYGFRIIDADMEAKNLLDDLRGALAETFGRDILKDGCIDKKLLAERAFSSEERLRKLNSIVHPPLLRKLREKIDSEKGDVALDAALIYEWGIEDWFDKIVVVACPEEIAIERMKWGGFDEEDIRRRWSLQIPQQKKMEKADIVILNDGTPEDMEKEVVRIIKQLTI